MAHTRETLQVLDGLRTQRNEARLNLERADRLHQLNPSVASVRRVYDLRAHIVALNTLIGRVSDEYIAEAKLGAVRCPYGCSEFADPDSRCAFCNGAGAR